jgi:putative membrane protein
MSLNSFLEGDKHMKSRLVAPLVSLALLSSLPAFAADATKATKSAVKPADKLFIQNTAIGSMAEVKLGELAQKNGMSQKVKDFGSQMVSDHTKANESLAKVASELGVTVPTKLDAKHNALVSKFSKLNGAKFDQQYATLMQSDHKKVVSDLEKEASRGPAPLKEWSNATLPTIKSHAKMASELASVASANTTK